MAALRSRVADGPELVVAGVLAALGVLVVVVLLWTRWPDVAFLVAFLGQFVSVLGLYSFRTYHLDEDGRRASAEGDGDAAKPRPHGAIVSFLVEDGPFDPEQQRRRRVAAVAVAFFGTAFLGFVVLTFFGGAVASLVP